MTVRRSEFGGGVRRVCGAGCWREAGTVGSGRSLDTGAGMRLFY